MRNFIRNACRSFRHWGKQVLVALDQLVNALFGGWADETLSSRCWRKRDKTGWKQARMALDLVAALLGDVDHCRGSYVSERLRLQCPPELRSPGRTSGRILIITYVNIT